MKGSGDGDSIWIGEGGVIGRGELSSGVGEMEPVKEGGEVTRVGETTWGIGLRLEEVGDGTLDSITSRGRIRSELTDTLEGDYEVVRVLEDNELDADDLWSFARRVVRD
jgi:hypothetical protein